MKKIIVLCCVFLLAFGLVSCDLRDVVVGPKDTWCRRSITIQDCEVDCYLIYTENGYTNVKLNKERFPNGIDKGLTVVLNPSADGVIGDLTSNCYTVKYLPLGKNTIEDENSETSKEITVNSVLWNSIWALNSTTFKANGLAENPPPLLQNDGNIEFLETVNDLSWKEVLIALIEGI